MMRHVLRNSNLLRPLLKFNFKYFIKKKKSVLWNGLQSSQTLIPCSKFQMFWENPWHDDNPTQTFYYLKSILLHKYLLKHIKKIIHNMMNLITTCTDVVRSCPNPYWPTRYEGMMRHVLRNYNLLSTLQRFLSTS